MDLQMAVALSILPRRSNPSLLAPASPGHTRAAPGEGKPGLPSGDGVEAFQSAWATAGRLIARAAAADIQPIALGSPEYPVGLASIPDSPPVLWVQGSSQALSGVAVAIVGSRSASPYAIEVAERLAFDLAGAGVVVVSGLARGVDSAAHRGTIRAGGRTVAVLGSGVDVIYPPEHAGLAARIAASGAVVSELPPGAPPRALHFPRRNRIISGISLAVVVVEASERSGSLITARCGLDQGREVMAVPGNVLTGRNKGSHGLLKDGAKVVETADDILEELRLPGRGAGEAVGGRRGEPGDPLLRAMAPGEAYDFDALMALSGLDGSKLLPRLLHLELEGRLARVEGGRFVRSAGKW